MLRITPLNDRADVTELKLEGYVVGDWVPVLEGECRACAEGGRKVVLDLRDVTFIDRRGLDSLRRLREVGVKWVGASSWIDDLLRRTER